MADSAAPRLLATLREVIRVLDDLDAPYMLVGGVALAAWARPRATTDVDIVIAVAADDLPVAGKLLGRRLGGVASMRPIHFRNGTTMQRVITQRPEGEVTIDLILANDEFLTRALERRARRSLGDLDAYVATAEDLLLMKLRSARPQDLLDARSLVEAGPLELAYVRRWAARLKVASRLRRVLPKRSPRK